MLGIVKALLVEAFAVALSAAIVIALALVPLGLLLVPPSVRVRSLVSKRRRLKELRLATTAERKPEISPGEVAATPADESDPEGASMPAPRRRAA